MILKFEFTFAKKAEHEALLFACYISECMVHISWHKQKALTWKCCFVICYSSMTKPPELPLSGEYFLLKNMYLFYVYFVLFKHG